MFFKNLQLYCLTEPFAYSLEEFNEQLSKSPHLPCPRSESFSVGWVSPYGLNNDMFVHSIKGYFLFAFCKEEKILPSTVIKDELAKKIAELEQREGRVLYRKEKLELKEQVIITLRHQAFSRKKITFAYLDTESNWLLVDTSSRNKAEEISSFLRKTLGSLKLSLPTTKSSPEAMMTTWVKDKQPPSFFKIENNCDMLDSKQKSGMIKCKEQDLNADEIIRHLHTGKQIVKLALNWGDKINFEFADDLSIKKIRFLELIQKQREDSKRETPVEQLDADFAIMTGEFSQFLRDLWSQFDGLVPIEN